jgi:hypothetical protein
MKIGDRVSGEQIQTRAVVMQQKTGRPVHFELLQNAQASLLAWLDRRGQFKTTDGESRRSAAYSFRSVGKHITLSTQRTGSR